MNKATLILTTALAAAPQANAASASDLADFVGYTIAAALTITGWQDENGKRGDSFEGCDYGRVIIFDNNRILRCVGYGYQYGYRPRAVILVNGSTFKMVVDSTTYDMRR